MDFKEGPDTVDMKPCPYPFSSYAWFLPSKTTAQAVKKNTLHLGMKLNLLHPKYVEHSITSIKLEQSKRRERGKPIKNSQCPKRKCLPTAKN